MPSHSNKMLPQDTPEAAATGVPKSRPPAKAPPPSWKPQSSVEQPAPTTLANNSEQLAPKNQLPPEAPPTHRVEQPLVLFNDANARPQSSVEQPAPTTLADNSEQLLPKNHPPPEGLPTHRVEQPVVLFNDRDARQQRENASTLISGKAVKDRLFRPLYSLRNAKLIHLNERDLSTEHAFMREFPWQRMLSADRALDRIVARGVTKCTAKFFVDEADANYDGQPRLDIVIYLADGTWTRWHPKAKLISSMDPTPAAVTIRKNLRNKMDFHDTVESITDL